MQNIRVVVTNTDFATALGIVRALRSHRPECIGLTSNPRSRYCRSRFWSRIVPVGAGPDAYLDVLLDLGKSSQQKMVLFVTSDALVKLLSDNREELGNYYHFVLPDKNVVDLLLDKTAFHSWALMQGFPVPESHVAENMDGLLAALDAINYPCLLKPLFHTEGWNISPGKIFLLDRKEDIYTIPFDLFQASPKFIVQQWIDGGDSDIHFCLFYIDSNGNEAGHYTGRKLLQCPIGTGSTAICAGTINEEVYNLAKSVFMASGFRGLGSVEFKQDRRTGIYYITEPTVGRHDLQSFVAVAGGVNLSLMALYDALHMDFSAAADFRKAVWIDEYNTCKALTSKQDRDLSAWQLIRKSVTGNTVFSSFSTYDPLPFLYYFKKRLSGKRR